MFCEMPLLSTNETYQPTNQLVSVIKRMLFRTVPPVSGVQNRRHPVLPQHRFPLTEKARFGQGRHADFADFAGVGVDAEQGVGEEVDIGHVDGDALEVGTHLLVNDGKIEKMFVEPEFGDNCPTDPFEVSDADTMLAYLKGVEADGVVEPVRAFAG